MSPGRWVVRTGFTETRIDLLPGEKRVVVVEKPQLFSAEVAHPHGAAPRIRLEFAAGGLVFSGGIGGTRD